MKNITILLFLAILMLQSQGQLTKPLTKEDYLRKGKNQKTTAWVLLIGGTEATTIGVAVALSGSVDQAWGSPTSR